MKKLKIQLKNCYGIKDFIEEISFEKKSANAIYAPNGTMKSSFALAFKDISLSQQSRDRVYEDRKTVRDVKVDDVDLGSENVFVIEPYSTNFVSDKISTLLANGELRGKYDEILSKINKEKDDLVKILKECSGIKKGLEDVCSKDFFNKEGYFLEALDRVENEVKQLEDDSLSCISYNEIFNDKVVSFLTKKDTNLKIQKYIDIYEQLLDDSTFFKKGIFNHTQATNVSTSLKANGFFNANHSILIDDEGSQKEISSISDLEKLIESEKEKILNNVDLKKAFDEIDKQLSNQDLRRFRDYLMTNKLILPELKDLAKFRKKLWNSYLASNKDHYISLLAIYKDGRNEIASLVETASTELTLWNDVVSIFNRRFSVPFEVSVTNQNDVILKEDKPVLQFDFKDEVSTKNVDKEKLITILSNGEKRALYLLDIIFEVQARKKEGTQTLFIVDDIADSFDYKNKYAIIEYLKDIMDCQFFYMLILTHNYDFYRTITNRLSLGGAKFLASKDNNKINLHKDLMFKTPFEKSIDIITNEGVENYSFISLIPYVRNLAEYCGLKEEEKFLTSALHLKENTSYIDAKNLITIFNKVLNLKIEVNPKNNFNILEKIYAFSNDICTENNVQIIELDKKIVLSIGIRLKLEKVLIKLINDNEWVNDISSHQTAKLLKKVKNNIKPVPYVEKVLSMGEKVSLMTPENIHLNSFMFEPILDMSYHHLISLYQDICNLEKEFESLSCELLLL